MIMSYMPLVDISLPKSIEVDFCGFNKIFFSKVTWFGLSVIFIGVSNFAFPMFSITIDWLNRLMIRSVVVPIWKFVLDFSLLLLSLMMYEPGRVLVARVNLDVVPDFTESEKISLFFGS